MAHTRLRIERECLELWRAHGAHPVLAQYTEDFDETREKDLFVYESPATVRAEIERYLETSATNYFVCRFAWGSSSGMKRTPSA